MGVDVDINILPKEMIDLKKMKTSSTPNQAEQLVNQICSERDITIEDISRDTRFVVPYIEKQISRSTLNPNESFLHVLSRTYGVAYDPPVSPDSSINLNDSADDQSLRGCTFAQRSALWYVSNCLPFLSKSECRLIRDVVERSRGTSSTPVLTTPYEAWMTERGLRAANVSSRSEAVLAARIREDPDYLCEGAAFLAEISGDTILCRHDGRIATSVQSETLQLLRQNIRSIDDSAAEQIYSVVWSALDVKQPRNTDRKVGRYSTNQNDIEKYVSPFYAFLVWLEYGSMQSAPSMPEVAQRIGYNQAGTILMLKGKASIPPRLLPIFVETFSMSPVQQELARFYSFISRRYLVVDSYLSPPAFRTILPFLNSAAPYLTDAQLDQIRDICNSAIDSAGDDLFEL